MSAQEMALTPSTPATAPTTTINTTLGAAQALLPYLAQSAPRWSWQQGTGLVLMGLLALWALLGPWLVDASPMEQNLRNQLARPGAAHWLGTDVLGRSWLARLAHATQLSLGMAVLAALSAAVPGTLLGVLAAWRGGRVERTLVMLADAVLAIPGLLLVLLIAALAPGQLCALYVGMATAMWV